MRRARPAHLLQRRLHLVGIVGQRLNLLAGQQVAEGIAPRVERALARVLADGDVFGDLASASFISRRVLLPARRRTSSSWRGSNPGNSRADGISSR